ncbi:TetR/AcrR family transcriptional regulator [Thalassobius sp. S69A]|uniref:TetR/AcrR family transcriptional regulator n=1 Tax=unclassified Thalassovita TaxID=2619711 RepID=UPI000C1107BC|nr:TetR family transcriptional regulator [Paracoccaceae bacterium]MBT25939.1 TetR family transcriptional regulator [Paracoccaceae bacterium]
MNTATKPIIRTGRKFEQVLLGAREIFMRDGFEGASVDDIAKAAGVSKATLYSYFPDKRLLFVEVASNECNRQAEASIQLIDQTAPAREVLTQAAQQMVGILISRFSQQMFRVCVAESFRFPEIGQKFYQSGPLNARQHMTEYLQEAVERGELRIADITLAADQFLELCKTDIFPRAVFGISTSFSETEIDRIVTGAVDMFLARYGAV